MSPSRPSRPAARGPLPRVVGSWIRTGLAAASLSTLSTIAGCKRGDGAAGRAHLEVVNASDRAWRIAITPGTGREPRHWAVAPRQVIEADVPAGIYAIEQTLLTAGGGTAEVRHFSAGIEAGASYRWRLTTLLSEPP